MRDVRRTAIDGPEIARGLQRETRRWLVIWSEWRQTYTAFACCTRESLIIDEEKIDRFLERIKEVEDSMIASGWRG